MTVTNGWDATEVRLCTTGNLWRAPALTAAPVDSSAPLTTPWVNLGYTSDDGFTVTTKPNTTDIMVWQSIYPARVRVVEELDFKFKLAQDNEESVMLAFGGGSWDTAKEVYTPPQPGEVYENAFCFDVIDGPNTIRYYVARAIVSDVADIVHKADEMIGYELTIKVLGVSSGGDPWQRISAPAFTATQAPASTTAPGGAHSSEAA
jgi:hypothetical protein